MHPNSAERSTLTPSPVTPDHELANFFEAMEAGFTRAAKENNVHSIEYVIGGRRVKLSIAGQGLLNLPRPLAHLQSTKSASSHDLQLFAWEGPSGWTPPKLVW